MDKKDNINEQDIDFDELFDEEDIETWGEDFYTPDGTIKIAASDMHGGGK